MNLRFDHRNHIGQRQRDKKHLTIQFPFLFIGYIRHLNLEHNWALILAQKHLFVDKRIFGLLFLRGRILLHHLMNLRRNGEMPSRRHVGHQRRRRHRWRTNRGHLRHHHHVLGHHRLRWHQLHGDRRWSDHWRHRDLRRGSFRGRCGRSLSYDRSCGRFQRLRWTDSFFFLIRKQPFDFVDLMNLFFDRDISTCGSSCCLHARHVAIPRDLLVADLILLANFLANGRFLVSDTENIRTTLGQQLQTALNSRILRVNVFVLYFALNRLIALLHPSRIQHANSHVFLNFARWNPFARDWRDEVVINGCSSHSFLSFGVVILTNDDLVRNGWQWRRWEHRCWLFLGFLPFARFIVFVGILFHVLNLRVVFVGFRYTRYFRFAVARFVVRVHFHLDILTQIFVSLLGQHSRADFFRSCWWWEISMFVRLIIDRFDDDEVVPVNLRVCCSLSLGYLFLSFSLRLLEARPLHAVTNFLQNRFQIDSFALHPTLQVFRRDQNFGVLF
uniref:Uncharacterized protein n=1 Tax=Strigamia maritima TaxID=126957 RepID=T1JDV4_STRMM